MLTNEESKSMDDCTQGVMKTLKEHKPYIGMATISLLLVSYAQECEETLESFLGKMYQCWKCIKDETDARSKGEEDANEKDNL